MIALVLLYQQMQWSIIPGIALLIIMIPINLFLQRIQKKLTVCICRYIIDFDSFFVDDRSNKCQ